MSTYGDYCWQCLEHSCDYDSLFVAQGLDADFRLHFEVLQDFTPAERSVAGEVLDSLILKHTANRLSARALLRG